jgi:hypothetical protein
MNKFVSWQTNGPQDHNIILNQLLDHPLNLQWEPPSKVLRSSVWMISEVSIKNMFSNSQPCK